MPCIFRYQFLLFLFFPLFESIIHALFIYFQQKIGSKFQTVLGLSDLLTDIQVGEELLNRLILVHLTKNSDKFEALMFFNSFF